MNSNQYNFQTSILIRMSNGLDETYVSFCLFALIDRRWQPHDEHFLFFCYIHAHTCNGFLTVLIVSYRHISWKLFLQIANKFQDESAEWMENVGSMNFPQLVRFPDTHHGNHLTTATIITKAHPYTYKACQMCKQPIDWPQQHKWTTYDERLIWVCELDMNFIIRYYGDLN